MYELKIVSQFAAAHQLRGFEGGCEHLHGIRQTASGFADHIIKHLSALRVADSAKKVIPGDRYHFGADGQPGCNMSVKLPDPFHGLGPGEGLTLVVMAPEQVFRHVVPVMARFPACFMNS